MSDHGGGLGGLGGDAIILIDTDPATQAAARRHVKRYARDTADEALLLDALGLGEG